MGGGFGGGIHRNTWVRYIILVWDARDGEFKRGPGCAVCPDIRESIKHTGTYSLHSTVLCTKLKYPIYSIYESMCECVTFLVSRYIITTYIHVDR